MKFAVAALIASAQAVQLDYTYMTMSDGSIIGAQDLTQTEFVDDSQEIVDEATQVQLGKVEELMPHFQGYTVAYNGFEGNNHNDGAWRDAYNRVVPAHLTGETRDTFTAKMVSEYAVEGQDADSGKPNGIFTVSKAKTREAALEVLATHAGLKGDDAEKHLKKYFDQVWDHFDVLEKGALEAVELNKFMRDLCKPVKEHINLE